MPYGLCHASDADFAWYPPQLHTIINENTVIRLEYLPDTIGWISIVIVMICITGLDQGQYPLIIEVSDFLSVVGLIGTLKIIVFVVSVPPSSCSPNPLPYTPYQPTLRQILIYSYPHTPPPPSPLHIYHPTTIIYIHPPLWKETPHLGCGLS